MPPRRIDAAAARRRQRRPSFFVLFVLLFVGPYTPPIPIVVCGFFVEVSPFSVFAPSLPFTAGALDGDLHGCMSRRRAHLAAEVHRVHRGLPGVRRPLVVVMLAPTVRGVVRGAAAVRWATGRRRVLVVRVRPRRHGG